MLKLKIDEKESQNYYLKVFLLGMILASLIFIPFIIYDKGYFLYYGDFNVQQIPFYQMIHDSIRKGDFLWSFTTDLGANTIGSYSFYLLGSPFFFITLLFPSGAVPYLMGPLLILKLACASLTGYIYLKRYIINQDIAIVGAILYAFSGFSIYNIFFNHFHEAIIVFPLLLFAVDEYMYNKRRGLLAFSVFLSCFINYYFFVGQVVFIVIYWFVKVMCGVWKIQKNQFLWMIFESIIGLGLASVLLLPTILAIIQNPRVDNPPVGWDALLYSNEQRYIHILQCFFFPPDIPARPNFTPDSNAKWASLGAWLPLFSMAGVIAFFKQYKNDWLKKLMTILFFMAMIPVFNSAFQLFNSSYYARWFYMLTLMMSLATVRALENSSVDWNKSIKLTLVITLAIALPIGLMPKSKSVGEKLYDKIGLMKYPSRFWMYVIIAVISLVILFIIINYFNLNRNQFVNIITLAVCAITIVFSMYIIGLGKSQSYDTQGFIIPYCLHGRKNIDLEDTEDCRVDVYNGMDNLAMFWQMPTIQAFHSIVPGSIMEFYPSIGVTRDVGSRPDTKVYGLRSFTSCKWLFDYTDNEKSFNSLEGETLMPGWSYYDTQNSFNIWKNDYYIPYGFTYDNYIPIDIYNNTQKDDRNLLLLKAIVLDNEQIKRHNDILKEIDIKSINFTKEDYFKDCKERSKLTCNNFSHDNTGFSANITTGNKDELVFFSIPYEKGWKAKVNGKSVPIEKVNIGFMAVRVPANTTSLIQFDYMTPGLIQGGIISGACIIIFIGYLCFSKRKTIK